ncbi:GerAB/ArcD/ProY family transporter [Paenibacillus radicis (ex Xue et al. 2023)]|uniref:Endospore germination permease n=1 Tax=Paenibacillus radicis (ex Xue et al. 2023) TaxID=2972489 RepID=A0ABT1YDY7_9BACL|nr:endospore germination permease [Paenibacillus radicis (ex Xue et al. 2023)]MCR8631406.1 endospore germination permease [Paenibacillus radicis (ex Xue et al. 2023)]
MEKAGVISKRSFVILVIFFMIGTSILITPTGLALEAKQDAWLACIVGVVFNLLNAVLFVVIGKRMGDQTLIQYCETTLGKWFGKAVSLCFVLFFYLLASLMIGDLGYFVTSQIMQETPMEVLQMLFILVVVMAVRSGFIVYTRAAEAFFPWLMILFLLLILPLIPKFEISNFLPVMEFGIKPIVRGGFSFWGLQELIVLLIFYPLVSKTKGRGNGFITGIVIGGAVLICTTVGSIAVLGATLTANQLFPAYTLAKNISIGHFLERVEGIMISIWVLSIFIKIVLTFHASIIGFVQVMNIKDEKPLIIPMALGLIVLSIMCYPNSIYINDYLSKNWSPFALIFSVFLPLLLLGASSISAIRAKSSKE